MPPDTLPRLLTARRIAARLNVPLRRVAYILATRPHIQASARAGTLRLYNRRAVAMIRRELNSIDSRQARRDP